MAELGAAQAAAAAMSSAPTFVNPSTTIGTPFGQAKGNTTNINTSVTGYNLTSPAATGATVASQIKYGQTVNTTTLAGVLAASRNVQESRVSTPAPAMSVSARLRDR
jgi:hypothetical protein